MTPEEESYMKIIMPDQPVIRPAMPIVVKPIELKNIGYLQKVSTCIHCPACLAETMSVVRLEAVTCLQKFLKFTNWCKTAESRYDINHYCSICGCYIGRYMSINCHEKCLSKRARRLAAKDAMTPRPERRHCYMKFQEAWQRITANMEKEREERRRKIQNETAEETNKK